MAMEQAAKLNQYLNNQGIFQLGPYVLALSLCSLCDTHLTLGRSKDLDANLQFVTDDNVDSVRLANQLGSAYPLISFMISDVSQKRIIAASGGVTGGARFCKLLVGATNSKKKKSVKKILQMNDETAQQHDIDEIVGPSVNIFD